MSAPGQNAIFYIAKNILFIGLPGGDRTPDPQLRRLLLYPTELRAEIVRKDMVGAKGFEPSTLWSQTIVRIIYCNQINDLRAPSHFDLFIGAYERN